MDMAARRLMLGLAQIIAATVTVLLWLVRAPAPLVVICLLATCLLVLASRAMWRGR
ncbi:MAG: hypothetical protein ACRDHE_05840 [Ktedonobacterales bacterium]